MCSQVNGIAPRLGKSGKEIAGSPAVILCGNLARQKTAAAIRIAAAEPNEPSTKIFRRHTIACHALVIADDLAAVSFNAASAGEIALDAAFQAGEEIIWHF